jgi:uncharacterized protein YcbK (DUF882 family)
MSKNYFDLSEFACQCKDKNCSGKESQLKMNPLLIQGLNRLREAFGKPLIVTSGFRCQAHNSAVGGAKASQHLYGTGVDIKPASGGKEELDRLFKLAQEEKAFTGIGDGRPRGFVHLDVRALPKGQTRIQWIY